MFRSVTHTDASAPEKRCGETACSSLRQSSSSQKQGDGRALRYRATRNFMITMEQKELRDGPKHRQMLCQISNDASYDSQS